MWCAGVLAEELRRRLLERPDHPVVTVCGARASQATGVFSGLDLHEAALERSAVLSRAFSPAHGPLALVMPCGADFVAMLFGAIYAGFTVTALAPPRPGVPAARFAAIVRDCAPVAILCPEDWRGRVETALAGAELAAPVVDLSTVSGLRPRCASDEPAPVGEEPPAILQYTSGSTRAPKAVKLSGANIVANAELANDTWGMDERGVFLSWLPHFHDMGLMGGILYPILAGGRTVLLDPLHMIQRPERWLRLIGEHGVTMSGGPAFAYSHCLEQVTDEQCVGLDLSSWTSAFCGAEPVPAALMNAFRARFGPYGLKPDAVFGSYGLAEYTLMAAGGNPALDADKGAPPAGCGDIEPCRVAPAMRENLRLVDPDTRRGVGEGQAGEIWLRGASVAVGYHNEPAETEATFRAVLADDETSGTWLRTGDIAVRQGDWLYVTGRLKDLLFANGRKVPATDVEWLAGEQDSALNPMAAAALMPDELDTGKAVLLIELKRRARVADEPSAGELIRRAVAGAWGIELNEIRILPSGTLPRTSSGKIRRREVAEAWRAGRLDEVLQ
ncbi:acyl-CoA synthetase (AMP-forming)/AMP-acid ligase II [Brevundimonas alba]|uniref:Acyl-CoA synthetase (AMP-forming)/AMP-acid ligase II n=2 Tax=Brevundimonas alba TaxID=74314 RepID=A0A7X5YJX3_9CAUL|nr:AMP-binding protein [Brevundimonas alba]NJC39835.1 acyl-CoA synthetase (AMP-forming)/AMP-acid ligase II [Brevundimonas alba]